MYFQAGMKCARFESRRSRKDGRFVVNRPPHDDAFISSILRELGGLERTIYGFKVVWHQRHVKVHEAI